MNTVRYFVQCTNKEGKLIYGCDSEDTTTIDTLLVLEDEEFDESTRFVLEAFVDAQLVFTSKELHPDKRNDAFNKAELAVEKAIS